MYSLPPARASGPRWRVLEAFIAVKKVFRAEGSESGGKPEVSECDCSRDLMVWTERIVCSSLLLFVELVVLRAGVVSASELVIVIVVVDVGVGVGVGT